MNLYGLCLILSVLSRYLLLLISGFTLLIFSFFLNSLPLRKTMAVKLNRRRHHPFRRRAAFLRPSGQPLYWGLAGAALVAVVISVVAIYPFGETSPVGGRGEVGDLLGAVYDPPTGKAGSVYQVTIDPSKILFISCLSFKS